VKTSWFKPTGVLDYILLKLGVKDKLASVRESLITRGVRHQLEEQISILDDVFGNGQSIQGL